LREGSGRISYGGHLPLRGEEGRKNHDQGQDQEKAQGWLFLDATGKPEEVAQPSLGVGQHLQEGPEKDEEKDKASLDQDHVGAVRRRRKDRKRIQEGKDRLEVAEYHRTMI
jgi:hypothetical protein